MRGLRCFCPCSAHFIRHRVQYLRNHIIAGACKRSVTWHAAAGAARSSQLGHRRARRRSVERGEVAESLLWSDSRTLPHCTPHSLRCASARLRARCLKPRPCTASSGIFVLASVIGLVIETLVSYPIDGVWKDRAGLVWGPLLAHLRRGRRAHDARRRAHAHAHLPAHLRRVHARGRGGSSSWRGWFFKHAFAHRGVGLLQPAVQPHGAHVPRHRHLLGRARPYLGESALAPRAARYRAHSRQRGARSPRPALALFLAVDVAVTPRCVRLLGMRALTDSSPTPASSSTSKRTSATTSWPSVSRPCRSTRKSRRCRSSPHATVRREGRRARARRRAGLAARAARGAPFFAIMHCSRRLHSVRARRPFAPASAGVSII